jgi:hypothetical protein
VRTTGSTTNGRESTRIANGNGHQLLLPGLISLARLPDGTAIARVHELTAVITTKEAARLAHCGEDLITGLCEDGTLTWRWKNFAGQGGCRLIYAPSLQQWIIERTRMGRLHPQFSFR